MNPDYEFRYAITDYNVRRGWQQRADLNSVEKYGVVTKPDSAHEARRLCVQMAREYVSTADERAAKASLRQQPKGDN